MKLIERHLYLDKLIDSMGTPEIKVITGVRRSGKSKLLEAFKEHVLMSVPDANVIHINFNLVEFEDLTEYHALLARIEELYMTGAHNFVLIDEVQMCKGFEKAINSLHATEAYDIYITGSNAFLLSSDLATLFTGRTFEIEVFPFSFAEFVEYWGADDVDVLFDRYVLEGGMAGSYLYRNADAQYRYIANVFDTLIVRDIRERHRVRDVAAMERLTDFMMDNIANVSSVRNIVSGLEAGGISANDKTIGVYLDHLCKAFLFYRVRRYDIIGKKYLASGDKYYLCDHSFRYAKLGVRNLDYGRVYENIVAIELMRRGWDVYVGTLYQKEVDFVAIRRSEKMYIQVSDDIAKRETFEREYSPLLKIRDGYPKMIIARTKHEAYTYKGIRVVDIARWLLGA